MLCPGILKFSLLLASCMMGRGFIIKPVEEIDCESVSGATRPTHIYNSKYSLLADGNMCCPSSKYNEHNVNYCIPNDRVVEICAAQDRGSVYEPCFHCLTCAKLIGEKCGGIQGIYGSCDRDLECVDWEDGQEEPAFGVCTANGSPVRAVGEDCGGDRDSLGRCVDGAVCTEVIEAGYYNVCVVEAQEKVWNESCGGAYGKLGRCAEGLRCSESEDLFLTGTDISGTCYREDDPISCFRGCSNKPTTYVCGSDGIWYRHRCYYRRKNCGLYKKDPNRIHKVADKLCGEMPSVTTAATTEGITKGLTTSASSVDQQTTTEVEAQPLSLAAAR